MTDAALFTWSLGTSRFDVQPQQHSSGSMRDFAKAVLAVRAESKATAGYVCGPLGGDGRRGAKNALQRRWLTLDVDHIDPDTLIAWRCHLTRWRGFGWPTASSTPEAPRERVIIELSEPVDRAQAIAIGALIVRDVEDEFGVDVRLDPCGFRAEQPAFVAPVGVRPFYLTGDPLDVPTWLAQAPPPRPEPPPATAVVVAMADARIRAIVDLFGEAGFLRMSLANAKGFAVTCPWTLLHTTEDVASSTVLLFPGEGNGWRGGFKCLHSHCAGRTLRDVEALLARAKEAMA